VGVWCGSQGRKVTSLYLDGAVRLTSDGATGLSSEGLPVMCFVF
jgi:hypothetical protein